MQSASEQEIGSGKPRVDYFLKPRDSKLLFSIQSVPIHWLDPKQFNEGKPWTYSAKKSVGLIILKKSRDKLLRLQLDLDMQRNWKKKYYSVGDYIEAGRQQLKTYADIVQIEEKNESKPLQSFLVWSVGMESIYVEKF